MKMRNNFLTKVFAVILLVVSYSSISAQTNYFNSSRNWALNKKEVYFGLSATNFLGDLGGGPGIGRQKSPLDMDFPATRAGFNGGFRYRFAPRFATKTNLNWFWVSGDDANTTNDVRNARNLSFRSMVIELSQQIEFIVWYSDNVRPRKKAQWSYNNNISQVYLFTGAGAFFYNPKARYDGSWVALRPLGTEGQNMADGPEPYKWYSFSIPVGIGYKTSINRYWRIGVELSYHKTFTDYMDDVSGFNYYDRAALAANNPLSAALADRSTNGLGWFNQGEQRGNSEDNDAFVMLNISAIYNISYKKGRGYNRSRSGVRPRF
jgi:hypothetical protein